MKILISNDDGIHAPGLEALHQAVRDLGDVDVVAPDSEQSAVGHAITLTDPLRTRPVYRDGALFGYAVGGTPADCVKLAACVLLPERPDLVISGINLGANAGISLIYSGTVSAATEGTILGIPSVAFSLATYTGPHWATAQHVVRRVVGQMLSHPLPDHVLLNVNIPNRPVSELRGFRPARMAESRFVETFEQRIDPRGRTYYWMDGYLEKLGDPAGTDLALLEEGYVTLTPVHFNLTHAEGLQRLAAWAMD